MSRRHSGAGENLGEKVRVGLVEMHVSPRKGAPSDRFAALGRAAFDDGAARRRAVLRVLRSEEAEGLDVIVFPGWTLPGRRIPKSVLAACGDRIVVLEAVASRPRDEAEARYPWTTFVVWDGDVVARARQLLATSAEVNDENLARLSKELGEERTFEHPKLGRTVLLVCGEPNVVREHAADVLPRFDTILNPAHTPSRLPAMQRKRARLAAAGSLFTTANTHDGWSPRQGRAQPASRRAVEWFRRGVRGTRPDAVEIAPGATLSVVELPCVT